MKELKPCPFCRSTNIDFAGAHGESLGQFCCVDCNASVGPELQTKEESVKRWNRRSLGPAEGEPWESVECLRDKLRDELKYAMPPQIVGRVRAILGALDLLLRSRPAGQPEGGDVRPTPDYKLSFGISFSKELRKAGYKKVGECKMDNCKEGNVYRRDQFKPTPSAHKKEKE